MLVSAFLPNLGKRVSNKENGNLKCFPYICIHSGKVLDVNLFPKHLCLFASKGGSFAFNVFSKLRSVCPTLYN